MSQEIGKGYAPYFMFKETNKKNPTTNKQQNKPHTQEPNNNPPKIKTPKSLGF